MAVKLTANYAKRLGLPGFSSHQFSVSVETELTDLGNVQGEATRLYGLLQDAIDREIQHVGFVPGHTYGMEEGAEGSTDAHTNGANGSGRTHVNGNGSPNGNGQWSCSEKQRDLIIKIVDENGLDRNAVEELAQSRFGVGVKMLNKLQASGLIAELIENSDKRGKRGGVSSNGVAKKGGAR